MFAQVTASQIHDLLAKGATTITANQRLARFRLKQYEQLQINQNKQAWTTPHICHWQVWLQQQWLNHGKGLLLSQQQEALLWRDVVAEDESTPVLNVKSLSKQAMEAWQILADYFIDPACLLSGGEEHTALYRWAKEVQHKAQANNFIQRHEILSLLSQTNIKPEQQTHTLILDGFDALSPAQQTFLKQLSQQGFNIMQVCHDNEPAAVVLQTYHDEESEIRFVCQHIRQIINQKTDAQIGVFIPDLEQRVSLICQIFAEELAPELSLENNADMQGQYFNLSLGSVLAKQPMIQAALNLLSFTRQQKFDYQNISTLLLNPYSAGFDEEVVHRAALDVKLRAQNNNYISLKQLLHICQHHETSTPLFEQHLQNLSQRLVEKKQFSGKQLLSSWLLLVDDILNDFGWHNMARKPHEIAQLQGWQDMVHQLSSLDDFCGLLSWTQALGRLQEFAFEQLFRPAPGLANVQIMGFLEASNLHFDQAFILSMDDNTWPPAARPHPLIPIEIQILHQTPHANSEREWLYAQNVWSHLLHVTPHLHVSYAKTRDQQDVLPSPFLNGLSQEKELAFQSQRYATQLQNNITPLQDMAAQNLPVASVETIRGGTGILASQSACAFQAFAKYRLKLEGLEIPSRGLNSREQGTLLHKVLELFWQKYPSQAALLALIEATTLLAEIKVCIDASWDSIQRFVPADMQWLEERRLLSIIEQWLLLESQRVPFKVVEHEQWRNLKLGDLTLHTKLDRVDVDHNGHRIILDYKTGESSASKALGERPETPQLPAYLIAEQDKGLSVDALAFAQVRYQGLGFVGFAQSADILPKIKAFKGSINQPEDWNALTQHWRATLNTLANAFMAGETNVAPKNTQSCTYCDFAGLCRITST